MIKIYEINMELDAHDFVNLDVDLVEDGGGGGWNFSSSLKPDYFNAISSSSSSSLQNMRNLNLNSTMGGGGSPENETWILPIYMQFNEGHKMAIIVYSILMLISAVGNITVLVTILRFRMKSRLNRVNLFLLHLAVADLLVTFLLMPLEISWHFTVSWKGGDFACRIMSFFRIFGLYLSGFILVCISLDRYFAVLKPLALPEAKRRGKIMLYAAWTGSLICSLPQAWIFHVEKHPKAQWYEQCVTYNFFSSPATELAYSVSGFILLYGFPLVMIISCYSCILYEIFKINNLSRQGENLRRSSMGALGRAKIRTLKMTIVIVLSFFCCWTPYNIMSLWYWIDRETALQVDQRVQKGLFLFACANSAVNPMVYGLFHIRRKKPATPRGSNNYRLQRLENDKGPYKVRVRWRPRAECLCATSSSQMNSSSAGRVGLRPLYEVNGRQIYLHGPISPLSLHHQNTDMTSNPSQSRKNNVNAPRKSRRVKFVNLKNGNLPFSHETLFLSPRHHNGNGIGAGSGSGSDIGGRGVGSAPSLFEPKLAMPFCQNPGHGNHGNGCISRKSSSSYHSIPNCHIHLNNNGESHSGESQGHHHNHNLNPNQCQSYSCHNPSSGRGLCHSQSHSGLLGHLQEGMDMNMDDPDAEAFSLQGVGDIDKLAHLHCIETQARSLSPSSSISGSGQKYYSTHENQDQLTSSSLAKERRLL